MITFKELGQLNKASENELSAIKLESLQRNLEQAVEAKIDRAIMLTRISNPEKYEIKILITEDISKESLQHVLAKYEQEGYSTHYVNRKNQSINNINYEITLGWEHYIGSFNTIKYNPNLNDQEIANLIVVLDNKIATELNNIFGKDWSDNIKTAYKYINKELYGELI